MVRFIDALFYQQSAMRDQSVGFLWFQRLLFASGGDIPGIDS